MSDKWFCLGDYGVEDDGCAEAYGELVVAGVAGNPNGCSGAEAAISRSRLYFATRSPRAGAPDLSWPQPEPTARSAMKVSSVSPERCEIIAAYPDSRHTRSASSVSDTVP